MDRTFAFPAKAGFVILAFKGITRVELHLDALKPTDRANIT